MTKTFQYLIAAILLLLPLFSFSQQVKNVHFIQEGKFINIHYDLSGTQIYKVRAYYSTNNGQTWSHPLKYVQGAVGLGQIPGKDKIIVWDVMNEKGTLKGDIKFKIEASIQRYQGTITPPPDDSVNSFCEYTKYMLVAKEDLEIDENNTWYGVYEFNYGIITDVESDGDFATIKIFVLKTSDKFFRSIDGENWKVYIDFDEIKKKTEITEDCMNKLKKLIVPGRRLKFSLVEGRPGWGSSMNGAWFFTYAKALNESSFLSETKGLYHADYNENILTWQKQNEVSFSDNKIKRIDFLKRMNGKYPYQVYLFDNVIIQQRLKNLIDDRYSFFIETWAVETPIQIYNNIFIAEGCQAHNCNMTNFIIVIDLSKNIMSVGIREKGKVELYSEKESVFSEDLLKWSVKD